MRRVALLAPNDSDVRVVVVVVKSRQVGRRIRFTHHVIHSLFFNSYQASVVVSTSGNKTGFLDLGLAQLTLRLVFSPPRVFCRLMDGQTTSDKRKARQSKASHLANRCWRGGRGRRLLQNILDIQPLQHRPGPASVSRFLGVVESPTVH